MNPQQQPLISDDAAAFLKTATSAPDFENLPLEGIPDEYSGPTFTKKDFVYQTVEAVAGEVTWIVVTPTAGVAWWGASQPAPIDPAVPVQWAAGATGGGLFPDAGTLFPGVVDNGQPNLQMNNTGEVVAGRMLSHCAELVVLNNAFNQFGSISTFKTPLLREIANQAAGGSVNYHISGNESLFKSPLSSEANVVPVRQGSYAVAMSREADFEFYPVLDDVTLSSTFPGYQQSTFPAPVASNYRGPAVCWDNGFDTIVFRIDVPAAVANQSFVLKIWRTWEFKPAASSLAHSIAHASPSVDRPVIDLYHAMSKSLPVSVPAKDNPDFWNTLLRTIKDTSAIMARLPLPTISMVGRGVHAVATTIDEARRNANPGPGPPRRNRPARRRRRRRRARRVNRT